MKTAAKLQIPPHVADRLLELLATDDGFRSLFVADRHAALVHAGLDAELVEHERLGCMIVGELASKAEIAATRAELLAGLTSVGAQITHHLFETTPSHQLTGVLR
ncbi:putative modified peptide [Kribbella sandramycini]|uniref:Putative modified peptide n=1 Tax=Kribbella sandramycini TaxID=60450 RepID=A0A7Y4KYS4_9ACTN|nr:NHLP-related RiPP peptide [Kribbella sandramycini]MBB6569011.1 putative modified peptide [Kribbella sandramycini]NOL41145.1 putative modified peptide [Kribbella sandramycini]